MKTDICDFCNRRCCLVNGQLRAQFPHLFDNSTLMNCSQPAYVAAWAGEESARFMAEWHAIARANPNMLIGLFKDYGMLGVGVICSLCEGTVE